MCGFAGVFGIGRRVCLDSLRKMGSLLNHRGPDHTGTYFDETIWLIHKRLSIVDLTSSGNQPMISNCGRYIIAYNGEVYNHLSIRNDLVSKGYKFTGTSDTETILYGFAEWGDELFIKLNGIFAICIYDKLKSELICVRDRFGVKPLYYFYDGNSLIFASEIKAILSQKIDRIINYSSLHEFLYYGYTMGSMTMFRGIMKILPGQMIHSCKSGREIKLRHSFFWEHEQILPELHDIDEDVAIKKTAYLLEESVKRQLMSDVPVGIFLSGGIDSTAIAAMAQRHSGERIKSYTAGFDYDEDRSELSAARRLSALYNTEHHEMMICGIDLADVIEKLVWQHDEPFSDAANIPLFLLTRELKGTCKVILQGDGGDELFGGYSRYKLMRRYTAYRIALGYFQNIVDLFPKGRLRSSIERFGPILKDPNPGRLFGKLHTIESSNGDPTKYLTHRYRSMVRSSNPFYYFQEQARRLNDLDGFLQQLLWIDSLIILPYDYLEKVDKSTMANSVEVRVPFLDNDLATFALRLPGKLKLKAGRTKYILREALKGIIPNDVLNAPKRGFGVPYKNWIKGPLSSFLQDHIASKYMRDLDLFDYDSINKVMLEHKKGHDRFGFTLWKLLNLAIWLEHYKVEL